MAHGPDEDEGGDLVDDAVEALAMAVAPGPEVANQRPAPRMEHDEQRHQRELRVHPPACAEVVGAESPEQPEAEADGGHATDGHDAEQLALHQLEPLVGALLVCADPGVIDEQPRQGEQPGEPRHDEDDVKGLDPKHARGSPGR